MWSFVHESEKIIYAMTRGGGTGEAGEAAASPESRAFTTKKF